MEQQEPIHSVLNQQGTCTIAFKYIDDAVSVAASPREQWRPVCDAQQSATVEREQPGVSTRLWGTRHTGVGQKLPDRTTGKTGLHCLRTGDRKYSWSGDGSLVGGKFVTSYLGVEIITIIIIIIGNL